MMPRLPRVLAALLSKTLCALTLLPLLAAPVQAQNGLRQIHEERSLYRNILVTEDSERRCLRFTITREIGQNQSCRYLRDPQRLVFPYAKMVLSSLLVKSEAERILILGLGGGTLVEVYQQLFPEAEIVISEIDPAVVRVAKEYFVFEETERIRVDESDGRVFVKRALLRDEKFDLVILDAFNGEYIPEHLMTREFLREVKGLLPPDGMVVANTFSTSRLYDSESATYLSVFGELLNIRMSGTGNRVLIASMQPLPSAEQLEARAEDWYERLQPFGLDVREYLRHMNSSPDWELGARLLTDQYSPANLLNN